jgi:MFS family permease
LLGYLIVTATFLVTCGRISDIFGRIRLYNAGFAVFTLGSILLFLTRGTGNSASIRWRRLAARSSACSSAGRWRSPMGIGGISVGVALLVAFVFVEQRVQDPLFRLDLFRIRQFTMGNIANFLAPLLPTPRH